MANSENNRLPLQKVNWYDGMIPENLDFQAEQGSNLQRAAYIVKDFHGSGILQQHPIALPPILDTSKPNPNNISFSVLSSGNFDGQGIFVDRQPFDTTFGDQLLITLENVSISLYSPVKVIIFGKIYDPNAVQGTPVIETIVFDKSGTKATYNYFTSIVSVFFNNFSGGVGRTDLSSSASTSQNTSINQTGKIVITEVGPLQVLDYGVVLSQTQTPNLDVRDFITSTITRKFSDEINAAITTAQNTKYVQASPTDVNGLPLNTSGITNKPFLDSTTPGTIFGQKIYLTTNNIQQLSFALSLADDSYGWSGELVLGIRTLQTRSIKQYANQVDLDPDVNVLFEASFTQSDLLDNGYVLTTTPQEIKFNFIGTDLAQPNGILQANQYYIITLTRRADTSTGKILIEAGPKALTNSKFSTFNPITKSWTDDVNNDLWFKIYSAAIRVSPGVAYSNDGIMVSLPKISVNPDGSIVSSIAGPYSLAVIDSLGSDNIVILQVSQTFNQPTNHPRTGNLVYTKIIDSVDIEVMNLSDFNSLISSLNQTNQTKYPIVLAAVNDLNNKTNPVYTGNITFPGQVRKNEIILFNTGISDDLIKINNIIIPDNTTSGIKYRIVNVQTTTQYLGDFNNDKLFTSSDLVEQANIQDTFSAQSLNTNTSTNYDPFTIFDVRSRDILGFGKETIEDFILSDIDGYLTINSTDVSRLQYLTTTLPAMVSPAPTTTSIQVLTLENMTNKDTSILVAEIDNTDGYANATYPDQVSFTALNVGDMRALSVGDFVDLSADGYTNADGTFKNLAYNNLQIKKFVQRNDLILETKFLSKIAPAIDTSYVLSFYNQNPVFNNKLGIFGEVPTEVLEFVAPGVDLVAANIQQGDIVQITSDALGTSRDGTFTISQVINATTFRVSAPSNALTAGTANAGIEIFASDGTTDKLDYTTVTGNNIVVQFTLNNVNLNTSGIQAGDIVHITLGPSNVNNTYTVARVLTSTTFTVVAPLTPLIAQTFNATFEFRAAGDIVVKIAPTAISSVILGNGPAPYTVVGLETLSPSSLPNGLDTVFNFTLTHAPITGDVNVYWTSNGLLNTMTFNASPVSITGDGNVNNSSINRETGSISIDTLQPPDAGTNITVDYRIAPTVVLKHCYPTVVSAVSDVETDVEFRVPFINPVSNTDINGIAGSSYVLIQTNNADPPNILLDSFGNVVSGTVSVNSINPSSAITTPSRNVVLQLIDSLGNTPNITSGSYWMQIYSGSRVNLPAVQKQFLSDTLGLNSPIGWIIQKNNFEWLSSNLVIQDYRRFLPAAFVAKDAENYTSSNQMWVPSDIYVGNGEILSQPGVPYHGDIEITKLNLDLPVTALLSNNINIYNNLIASYAPTPGITRGGYTAMKFSDGTYVGADDFGLSTALTKNQIRIIPSINSIYLDGYQVPNATVYSDLDEVLTKLHYEIRMGMYYDDANGILYFHTENIKSVFENEPIVQTGVARIVLDVALKKSGFANPIVSLNAVDILRLFSTPVNIIPAKKYSIAGQIYAGFTVGATSDNPDG